MTMQQGFVELRVSGADVYVSLEPSRASAFAALQARYPGSGLSQMAKVYGARKPKKRRFAYEGFEVLIEGA